jgi:hypothetical protein
MNPILASVHVDLNFAAYDPLLNSQFKWRKINARTFRRQPLGVVSVALAIWVGSRCHQRMGGFSQILDATMAKPQNGRHNGPGYPPRSLRFDDVRPDLRGNDPETRQADDPVITEAGQGLSGRRFVVIAAVVVLLTWGGLFAAFHRWRANYRERVAYGASNVVPVVDSFKAITPPGVDASAWRDAVDKTHAMVATVVGSNLLDRAGMDKLKLELNQRAARVQSHPETATTELAAIWNDLADRAEFLFQDSRDPTHDRHPRPRILPPRPEREKARQSLEGVR